MEAVVVREQVLGGLGLDFAEQEGDGLHRRVAAHFGGLWEERGEETFKDTDARTEQKSDTEVKLDMQLGFVVAM